MLLTCCSSELSMNTGTFMTLILRLKWSIQASEEMDLGSEKGLGSCFRRAAASKNSGGGGGQKKDRNS